MYSAKEGEVRDSGSGFIGHENSVYRFYYFYERGCGSDGLLMLTYFELCVFITLDGDEKKKNKKARNKPWVVYFCTSGIFAKTTPTTIF